MLKSFLYILVLVLLGGGIYFFIIKKNDNPYGNNEAGFTIKDTGSIGKFFFASAIGQTITVERKGSIWMVNGKYKALPGMVNMVLGTFVNQAPLYPVTKNAYETTVKGLATDGIKVEVYDREGKKMRVFYVGGTSVGATGTNMMMEGAKTPYVVQTSAAVGDLRPRYAINIMDWRDRTVLDIPAEEIKQVSIKYATNPINSFVLIRDVDKYRVEGDKNITGTLGPLNTERIKRYINYFTNVNCEGYLNGLEDIDSLMKISPKRAEIDVETMHNVKSHVDVFWMPVNRRSRNLLSADADVPDDFDADRMFAVTNGNKDTIQIQMLTFNKILRKCFEFYQEDEVRQAPHPAPNAVINHK